MGTDRHLCALPLSQDKFESSIALLAMVWWVHHTKYGGHRLDGERPACHPFVIMQATLTGSYTERHQPCAVQCLCAPCVVANHGESNDAISRDPPDHRRDLVAKKIISRLVASRLAIGAPSTRRNRHVDLRSCMH